MKRRWLPDHVTEYRDRHGKPRYRYRRAGQPDYHFKSAPGSKEFMDELAAARAAVPPPVGDKATPGTIDDLVQRFYASPAWRGRMKESSQRTYRGIIERFRTAHGSKRVATIQPHHLDAILGKMVGTPAAANNLRKVLKRLFAYACKCGMRPDNPAVLTESFRTSDEGFHTWTEDEIAQFEAHHAIGTKARLALALMLYTGQRRSDAILLGRQHVQNGRLRLRQVKTGEWVSIPIHPMLRAAIDATPVGNMTFLVTEFDKPFSSAGFGNWFRKRCNEAGLPQCAAHGLRKAMARRLMEVGATVAQGKAVTGHRSDRTFNHYADRADRERLADAGMANLAQGFAKLEDEDVENTRHSEAGGGQG